MKWSKEASMSSSARLTPEEAAQEDEFRREWEACQLHYQQLRMVYEQLIPLERHLGRKNELINLLAELIEENR